MDYMKEILLTQGQSAIVDECDYEELAGFKWYAQWSHRSQTFYAARRVYFDDGTKGIVYMHRHIMKTPKGYDTHHKDNCGLHNWRDNLTVATRAQNTSASRGPRNTTGFRGVCKKADPRYKNKLYYAKIVHQGKAIFLGNFATAEEASIAYESKARELFGEFYKPMEERMEYGRQDENSSKGF